MGAYHRSSFLLSSQTVQHFLPVHTPRVLDAMQAHVEAFYRQLERDGIQQRFTHRLDGALQWRYNQVRSFL